MADAPTHAPAWIRWANVWVVLMLLGAALAGFHGWRSRADFRTCAGNANVACVDELPYYAFEAAVFLVAALLTRRAIARRTRARRDLWTMRVYWPAILVGIGLIATAAFALTLAGDRGCAGVTPVYVAYGCWDVGVMTLRVMIATFLTALVMHVVARDGTPAARRREPEPPAPPPEPTEEIPAR